MTKMLNVKIDTTGIDEEDAREWIEEIANVYADMEIEDINISGKKISFKAGFSGIDDTEIDDIKMRLEGVFRVNNLDGGIPQVQVPDNPGESP